VTTISPQPLRRDSRDHLLAIWREILLTDGFTDPFEAVLHELSLYFKISPEEAKERCLHWAQDSIAEWEAQSRDTSEGLLDFYQSQQSWIFDTVWYHAQQCAEELPPESVMIAERLGAIRLGRHLDFGAGPGSTSLFFHRLGWEISLADISTTMQDFAKWRLGRRGVSATYYNTASEELPPETFDLITACDVMVHVPDPRATLERLHRSLKMGGYLLFNVDAQPQVTPETQWNLHRYAYPVLRPVRALGFAKEPRLEFFHVFRKVEANPPIRAAAVTAYDTLRYNLAVAKVGQVGREARRQINERLAARRQSES